MTTVEDVLAKYVNLIGEKVAAELAVDLLAREDAMADRLRIVGSQQFGLYPEIVAEVLAEVGLGTPLDETTREFVHANFVTLMLRLQDEHRRQQGDI